MLFEDILFLLMGGAGIFFIDIPFYKFLRAVVPQKRNSLAEAKERLEQARLDAEAARLNKEAEQLYTRMYDETLG
jgi:hypothetical protein